MGKKIKVVPDTNVYISALGWDGNERKILNLCIDGLIDCFASIEILNELLKALDYPKFSFNNQEKEDFITSLLDTLKIIEIPKDKRVNIIKDDPEDDKFIICAIEVNADYIVTGDKHLLKLEGYKGIEIINASRFINKIRELNKIYGENKN